MKRPYIKIIVIKEEDGTFSAMSEKPWAGIFTQADTAEELKTNIIEAAECHLEAMGLPPVTLKWSDFEVVYDVPSLLESYHIINISELAKRLGMNNALISQYASRKKVPSRKQAARILEGLKELGKELSQLELV